MGETWEYSVLEVDEFSSHWIQGELNRMGSMGWEMVGVSGGKAFLKRCMGVTSNRYYLARGPSLGEPIESGE